jgi:hypothetical protein
VCEVVHTNRKTWRERSARPFRAIALRGTKLVMWIRVPGWRMRISSKRHPRIRRVLDRNAAANRTAAAPAMPDP